MMCPKVCSTAAIIMNFFLWKIIWKNHIEKSYAKKHTKINFLKTKNNLKYIKKSNILEKIYVTWYPQKLSPCHEIRYRKSKKYINFYVFLCIFRGKI